jgi:glycosyltransferase involved in cell wall biosynthesis
MRLTMLIHSMSSGGAERVLATTANAWAARGWRITLLTFDDGSEAPFYRLDPRIEHRPLGIERASSGALQAVTANLRRALAIRRAIVDSKPDAVLSFLDVVNVRVLLSTIGISQPVIVKEETDPGQKQLGKEWKALRRLLYPLASRVVVLSEDALSYFPASIQRNARIIPNPIEVGSATSPAQISGKTAIAMGRFVPEKGFDMLLDAFARIERRHPDWRLVIWGDGPLRPELETQRDRLGLRERAELPGRTADPFTELRAADLFVMSSRREGFPMALGEAMACGLPAVSFDCRSGPRQLIRPGIDGVLVENANVAALADAMSDLMTNDDERRRLAERAPDVLERFGTERVLAMWEKLILDVRAEKDGSRRGRFSRRSARPV